MTVTTHARRIERTIILLVLDEDHAVIWSRSEIEVGMSDVEPLAISDALAYLAADGVLQLDDEQVHVSRCVRHLDSLGLIYATDDDA
jgi:hypothetical protein